MYGPTAYAQKLLEINVQGRREVRGGGPWGKIFSKLLHWNFFCISYLNANEMKLQCINERISNIVEFS